MRPLFFNAFGLDDMDKIIKKVDGFIQACAMAIRWLSLLMVVLTCLIVALRYGSSVPFIAYISQELLDLTMLQELVMYCHGALFMLGAAFTLQQDAHVRVDIFYRTWGVARKNKVNSLGIVFLAIPFCVFTFFISWDLVIDSWKVLETSQEPGGLPFVYLFKTLLLVMPVLVCLQCIAELLKAFLPVCDSQSEVHS